MTATKLAAHVGRVVLLRASGLDVEVMVLDARQVFDRVDLLVTPTQGSRSNWVSAERVVAS